MEKGVKKMITKKRFLTALYTGALIGVLLELKDGAIHITKVVTYCVVYVCSFFLIAFLLECIRWIMKKYF